MKQFSETNDKGDMGESIFESLIRPYAVPHSIGRSKDIGVDFLCEWKNGTQPTGVIFAVQVKYYPEHTATLIEKDRNLNLLDKYIIAPTISIDSETQEYWKLLGMPAYLFVVIQKNNSVNVFYKRYTPILTGNMASQPRSPFFKANNEWSFLAFADMSRKVGGFVRDLYIDQMRANYNKGQIAYMNPRRLGLEQFPNQDDDVFFKDIFQEYKNNFKETFERLRSVLGNSNDNNQGVPSKAQEDSE